MGLVQLVEDKIDESKYGKLVNLWEFPNNAKIDQKLSYRSCHYYLSLWRHSDGDSWMTECIKSFLQDNRSLDDLNRDRKMARKYLNHGFDQEKLTDPTTNDTLVYLAGDHQDYIFVPVQIERFNQMLDRIEEVTDKLVGLERYYEKRIEHIDFNLNSTNLQQAVLANLKELLLLKDIKLEGSYFHLKKYNYNFFVEEREKETEKGTKRSLLIKGKFRRDALKPQVMKLVISGYQQPEPPKVSRGVYRSSIISGM